MKQGGVREKWPGEELYKEHRFKAFFSCYVKKTMGIWCRDGKGEGLGRVHSQGKDRPYHWLNICHAPGVVLGDFI